MPRPDRDGSQPATEPTTGERSSTGTQPGYARSARSRVTDHGLPPDEMSLSKYWNAGRLPAGCRTTDGRSLDIVYRGQWSHGYGPDFRNAILCFENGPTVRGDVEIHVHSSGWARHGHAENPSYERVVLHIVWHNDVPIAPGAAVLEMSRYVSPEELTGLPDPGRLDGTLCEVFRTERSTALALEIIEAAGDERFEGRCAACEGELESESPEQVLYRGLMECMGYSENKLPFRMLADALPLTTLADANAPRIESRLHAASGLIENPHELPILSRQQWSLARVRPANHPLRRMSGIARLIARAEREGGLAAYLLASGSGADPKHLLSCLQVSAPDGPAYIGGDRAGDAACNVVLPISVALGRSRDDQELERWARRLWLAWPGAAVTQVERSMREHLDAPHGGRLLGRARRQQGLLHLYRRYCAQRLCDVCPLSKLASS